MMFSLIERSRKVVLPLVLLGFSALASNVCPECERVYSSISSSVAEADRDLVQASNRLATLRGALEGLQNNIRNAETYNQNVNVSQYLLDATSSVVSSLTHVSDVEQSVTSARQRIAYVQGQLDSFSCSCSGGSCGCVEVLNSIMEQVTSIWEEIHYNISPMMFYLNEWLDTFKEDFDAGLEWLEKRLDRFDDDYYSDLRSFNAAMYNRFHSFDSNYNLNQVFTSVFTGSTPSYSIGNELLALSSIAGTSTLCAMSSYDSALSLRYIASNLNVRSGTELQFISNYLDTVQRKYFELFNKVTAPGIANMNPFKDLTKYKTITNAWQRLSNPKWDYSMKSTVYDKWHSKETNWFARIENYLLGFMGAFDSPHLTGMEDVTESTAVDSMIGSFTNSLDLADLSSYSNTVGHLIDRFTETVNRLSFEKSDEDVGFTIMPSFTFGGISFNEIIMPYQTIAPITDFVRSAFRVVWYAIFLFLGFILITRVIRLFIQTVAHVILVVKTLL